MEFDKTKINIEKYIQGELSGNALKEFETQIKKDEVLQKKVNFYQYTDSVLHNNLAQNKDIDAEFKSNLEKFGNKYFSEEALHELNPSIETKQEESIAKASIIKRLMPFIALAAAALLLFFFLPGEKNTLYANFFETAKLINDHSSSDNSNIFSKANKQYRTENFKEAIPLYEKYITENSDPYLWAFVYKGCSHMVLDQIDLAINTFQQLSIKDSDFKEMANWYLALCHLKKGDKEQSKTILKHISPEDKEYYDKAQQLLKKF